jgi:hypothetical protein
MKHLKRFNESIDLYNSELRHKAFDFAEINWSDEILHSLLETENNIESILSGVDNLGNYSMEEWIKFFTDIRKNGI